MQLQWTFIYLFFYGRHTPTHTVNRQLHEAAGQIKITTHHAGRHLHKALGHAFATLPVQAHKHMRSREPIGGVCPHRVLMRGYKPREASVSWSPGSAGPQS